MIQTLIAVSDFTTKLIAGLSGVIVGVAILIGIIVSKKKKG